MEASLVEAPPPEHAPEATAERVLARVERAGRDVPAGVARTPTSGGQTVLQVSFENNDAFDRHIDGLLVAIAPTPE